MSSVGGCGFAARPLLLPYRSPPPVKQQGSSTLACPVPTPDHGRCQVLPSAPPSSTHRLLAGALFGLIAGAVAVLTLLAVATPPQPNGFGLLPQTVQLMQRSGVILSEPTGHPAIAESRAVAVARRQGRQDQVERVVLAHAASIGGGPLGAAGKLCWVVLLQANPDAQGNLPAPGRIQLYMVLVDARSGRFLEGVIAFSGQPQTGVGSE
jgi:hypothetical protein